MSNQVAPYKWVLDPSHSLIEFAVKHMMLASVKGRFTGFQGAFYAALPDLTTAEIEVEAEAATIDTRDEKRDEHLRSADFLDAENYPKLSFKSRRVDFLGESKYQITGDLTIHGVTKEVLFAAEFDGQGRDPWGNERAAFSAQATINRKDFGLVWNVALETGGILVGEQVKIAIQAEAVREG